MVICNTGPLIALERVGLLHLPEVLYGPVLIPDVVEREFLAGQPAGNSFDELKRSGLVEVSTLSEQPDPLLAGLLDAGEAAVIQLARTLNVSQVLIDERKGRKVARDVYGLSTIGTVRVLLDAKQRGLIDTVQQSLLAMRSHGYHIHEKIVQAALQQAHE